MFKSPKTTEALTAPTESDQKRAAYRAMIEFPVFYVVDDRQGTRMASANDLSVGGLRLLGDEDFTNDTVIDFRFTLPNEAVAGVLIEKEIEERPAIVMPQRSSSYGLAGFGKTEVDRASLGPQKKRVKVPPPPFKPMDMAGKIVIAFYNTRTSRFAQCALPPRPAKDRRRDRAFYSPIPAQTIT